MWTVTWATWAGLWLFFTFPLLQAFSSSENSACANNSDYSGTLPNWGLHTVCACTVLICVLIPCFDGWCRRWINDGFLHVKRIPKQLQRAMSGANDAGCHWHAFPEEICKRYGLSWYTSFSSAYINIIIYMYVYRYMYIYTYKKIRSILKHINTASLLSQNSTVNRYLSPHVTSLSISTSRERLAK